MNYLLFEMETPATMHETFSPSESGALGAVAAVRRGLPVDSLNVLQKRSGLTGDRLARHLGLSKATLHRRRAEGRFSPDESDRLLRFTLIVDRAIETFDGVEAAQKWLNSPQYGLGGATPFEFAETEIGGREVADLLGRIEYGVYS